DMLPYTRWARWLARPGSDLFQYPNEDVSRPKLNWRPGVLPLLVLSVVLVLQIADIQAPIVGRGWAHLDPTYWPDEETRRILQQHESSGDHPHIFNEYLYGGYLIYFTPGYRVFVDDRCELYGGDWLRRYVDAETHETAERIAEWEKT